MTTCCKSIRNDHTSLMPRRKGGGVGTQEVGGETQSPVGWGLSMAWISGVTPHIHGWELSISGGVVVSSRR